MSKHGYTPYAIAEETNPSQVIGNYIYNGAFFVGYEGAEEVISLCDFIHHPTGQTSEVPLQGAILWSMDTDQPSRGLPGASVQYPSLIDVYSGGVCD